MPIPVINTAWLAAEVRHGARKEIKASAAALLAQVQRLQVHATALDEALRDLLDGTRLDAHGNRNDDGLVDHGAPPGFEERIYAARMALLGSTRAGGPNEMT